MTRDGVESREPMAQKEMLHIHIPDDIRGGQSALGYVRGAKSGYGEDPPAIVVHFTAPQYEQIQALSNRALDEFHERLRRLGVAEIRVDLEVGRHD